MRTKIKDLEEAVCVLKPNKKTNVSFSSVSKEPNADIVTFTLLGKQDTFMDIFGYLDEDGYPSLVDKEIDENYVYPAEESDNAYAYVDYTGKRPKYYVKKNVSGFLANPNNQLGNYESHAKATGRKTFEYVSVNRVCFQSYIKFLKTKNVAHLNNAQREYDNR